MSINCDKKNPLQRDGTSQEQRTLKTLLPGYVAVDERSIDDLRSFAIDFAGEIKYFKNDNTANDTWVEFFDKTVEGNSQYNAPHYALFMAFLKLFRYAQDEINQITKKHLDFYYRDVLHLAENPAVPDQVYLIFELAKHASTFLLEKDTAFKAGKDSLGNNVVYKIDRETALNKAFVSELKAVFVNKDDIFSDLSPYPANNYRLYASPVANSGDGIGAEPENDEKSWRTFGGITFPDIASGTSSATVADRDLAEVGFAFASPVLFLAEGERIVKIYLNFSSNSSLLSGITSTDINDAFRLKFSGEKEWIEPIWQKTFVGHVGEVDSVIAGRILDYINNAKTAAEIAGNEPTDGPIFDNPLVGFGNQVKDYDIGLTVAARIITERDKLHSKKFTTLDQLYAIKYIGIDKINDLIYSFGEPPNSTKVDVANNRIIIKRTITRDQAAIVAYNKENLLDDFSTEWPVVKVILNTKSQSNPFIYKKLKELAVSSADIVADVREVKNLVIQNDQSVLDPGKPFQPFGNRPIITSNFFIGSWEIFQKRLNELKINVKWFGLPDDSKGFNDYYNNYYPTTDVRNNDSFVVNPSILDKKSWVPVSPDDDTIFNANANGKLKADKIITFTSPDPAGEPPVTVLGNIDRDVQLEEFDEFDQKTQKGFIKLSLDGADFGHKDYQRSYTNAVLTAITPEGKMDNYTESLPNEPYTPEIESLSVDYISCIKVGTKGVPASDYNKRVEQFFHVLALGVSEIDTTRKNNYLLPQYNNEGELYIGIKELIPQQNLSVLFQISEGTSDPDLIPPKISWSYLSNNNWVDFNDQDILSDSTNGLITTGVIIFGIPSDATNNNTALTNGLYWLRATASKDSNGIPELINVICQAAKAGFSDNDNDPEFLSKPLPEKTISKLQVADSSVKSIEQPYTSFGGKVKETSNDFYTRVSERLRHKNRAITIWDYERIILQNFPDIYKAKCLNHTRFEGTFQGINEASPGNVSIIIVSNVRNKNAVDPLKPRTSLATLYAINDFIDKVRPPFINLHIHNPLFEEVRVKFNVKFFAGYDKGIYSAKLENAIIEFLSPWAFQKGSDLVFGGKIHKSVILHFVEEQEYVDYVTCFEMYHIVPDDPENNPLKDVDEAVASTSASILGSSSSHSITVLKAEEECLCPDNEVITVKIASTNNCPCE
ncbi:MAG: baseplate J/gp47 family protein [Bacteroidales bacterium]|nr:baseplate J/gp47 family protein [Bacteroidales bacterium]